VILAFDTSAAHCAAALLRDGPIITARAEEMGRGQAERLMPLLSEILIEGGATWAELTRIAVGIGPGNFTGIRISVSAARGLALALGVPAVGVSSFDVASFGREGPHLPCIPGPRGQSYIRPPGDGPRLAGDDEIAALGLPRAGLPDAAGLAATIARIAAEADTATPPAPLYVKPADAAPSRDTPPVILR
jgi:tRNA threonylcarbamoyl adenosine modification protein YeaZ